MLPDRLGGLLALVHRGAAKERARRNARGSKFLICRDVRIRADKTRVALHGVLDGISKIASLKQRGVAVGLSGDGLRLQWWPPIFIAAKDALARRPRLSRPVNARPDALFSRRAAEKVFGLSFDDGFLNVYRHALPVLQRLDFTATNYFVAGHPGGFNFWDIDKGIPESPLMGRREILEWAKVGNEVGAHTVDHADLSRLDDGAAAAQIADSRTMLEDLAAASVKSFCYPWGKYRAEHAHMARVAGFSTATTTNRGLVQRNADMWQLPRVSVALSTYFLRLTQKLFTSYEDERGQRG